jgi:hypothetical protein
MGIYIPRAKSRRATADDAEFLAWVTLAASRAHLSRGLWDVIIGADEAGCRNPAGVPAARTRRHPAGRTDPEKPRRTGVRAADARAGELRIY